MELRPELVITAVIKSLRDNVFSAIDPQNMPALQQAQLSIALLEIVQTRMLLMYRYDRHDLSHLVELAHEIAEKYLDADEAEEMRKSCRRAQEVLDRAKADPSELIETVRSIRGNISNAVRSSHSKSDKVRALEKLVVQSAAEMTLRERSWAAPFGFEADPGAVPEIETLLDPVCK